MYVTFLCVCMRQRIMEGLTLSSSPSSAPSAPLLLLRTAGNHAHFCCRKQPCLIRYRSSRSSRSSGRSSISIRHSRPMRALSDPKTEESSLPEEEDQAANVNFSEIENGVSSSLIDKNISQVLGHSHLFASILLFFSLLLPNWFELEV